jgi:putative phosphoesterase
VRVLILADVQANWEALDTLLATERQVDAVLCLGDLVGLGPDPAAVSDWFARSDVMCVQGDDDRALVEGVPSQDQPEVALLVDETLEHARRVVSARARDWLAGLPRRLSVTLDGLTFSLMHGDDLEGIGDPLTAPEEALLAALGPPADVYLVGHTHRPGLRRLGASWLVNPGSLGQPRYGSPDATYAVWGDGDLKIHHLHYQYPITARKLGLLPLEPETLIALREALTLGMAPTVE